jgi:hypothetical protein
MAADGLSALVCGVCGYAFLMSMWRCPRGTGDYQQQRLPAWFPVLTPIAYIGVFMIVACAFLVAVSGVVESGVEMSQRYDPKLGCPLGTTCQVTFEVKEDMEAPVYVYYEIENFYQNHRDYLKSMYWPQLHWLNTKDKCESDDCVNKDNMNKGEHNFDDRDDWEYLLKSNCKPLWKDKGRHLSPCGVVPNTMFDDVIKLNAGRTTAGISMREDKIAWKSDVNNVFQQPLGFDYYVLGPDEASTDACFTDSTVACQKAVCDQYLPTRKEKKREFEDKTSAKYYKEFWNKADLDRCFGYTCKGAPVDAKRALDVPFGEICKAGEKAVFVYPDPDKYQYLYETFPDVISPLVGVESERFAVWMKIAALPTFRKLYGRINDDLKKGDILAFDIDSKFDVDAFSGKKAIVVATAASFENTFLMWAFVTVACVCLAVAIFFGLVQAFAPRVMGKVRYSCLNPRPKDA